MTGSGSVPTAATADAPNPSEPPPHALLAGKVVVLTAAAGTGIGFATAKRCTEEGATVVISDTHERRLGEAADKLGEISGTRPLALVCNVTEEREVRSLYGAAISEHGHLDVAVNNAGLGGNTPIVDMSDQQWSSVIDVTLTGTFRCTRAVLPHFYERRSGVVVNNASVLAWRAQANQAHYAAAKAGVMALTRCAAVEAAPYGVRVNAVSPSLAIHPFLNRVIPEDELALMRDQELFRRSAETWEVANVIVFLASDYSSYMSGEIVSVSSQHP
jgi:3-oxoacyl-[acyl-carrier protein] reductase